MLVASWTLGHPLGRNSHPEILYLAGGLEHFFYFSIHWASLSQLTNIFQRGWNHFTSEWGSTPKRQKIDLGDPPRSRGGFEGHKVVRVGRWCALVKGRGFPVCVCWDKTWKLDTVNSSKLLFTTWNFPEILQLVRLVSCGNFVRWRYFDTILGPSNGNRKSLATCGHPVKSGGDLAFLTSLPPRSPRGTVQKPMILRHCCPRNRGYWVELRGQERVPLNCWMMNSRNRMK